ncbi:MAG: rRNA maturation RNase YbeY [Candidatus Hydrogenedentes bacterium]|nr:rRNA maturation RNase YbeY [Candidatus Hydrogenedentota bacterium]
MSVTLRIRNESTRKRLYRRDALLRRAKRICDEERVSEHVELSVLFCDDPFMQSLNKEYRSVNRPTDVLSFEQLPVESAESRTLGDIVISLETVEHNCMGDRKRMRQEVYLLFCHGLLHLLGYDHATIRERKIMQAKQAHYLGLNPRDAWSFGPKRHRTRQSVRA